MKVYHRNANRKYIIIRRYEHNYLHDTTYSASLIIIFRPYFIVTYSGEWTQAFGPKILSIFYHFRLYDVIKGPGYDLAYGFRLIANMLSAIKNLYLLTSIHRRIDFLGLRHFIWRFHSFSLYHFRFIMTSWSAQDDLVNDFGHLHHACRQIKHVYIGACRRKGLRLFVRKIHAFSLFFSSHDVIKCSDWLYLGFKT